MDRSGALNEEGLRLGAEGRVEEAVRAFQEAAQLAPRWFAPWFNLGLLYKSRRAWLECVEANQRAVELDPTCQPALWNLGIAASGAGEWEVARLAWRALGVQVEDGEGPPELDLGPAPILIGADGTEDVVWAQRLDPARARITGVPRPDVEHRFGDVVLHDAEKVGERMRSGALHPVFASLGRMSASKFHTYEVVLDVPSPADVEELEASLASKGRAADDWTSGRGLVLRGRGGRDDDTWRSDRVIGIAAAGDDEAAALLRAWSQVAPARRWTKLRRVY